MLIRPAPDRDPEAKPGARLKVRDPVTMHFLSDDGEEKPDTEYWLRRLIEGGVERVAPASAPAPAPAPAHAPAPVAPPAAQGAKP